ncbi:uncharacterized protein LOC143918255 [Arctopsyche grandis]|uniref:uncharacterized protein LOC143918255 n=1 Tax=Arctopsyche grandis TaxID=121162 RepID=UPI00406D77AC
MARLHLVLLPLVFAVAFADVAYYVPKAFYTIDKFGHESAPVLLFGGLRAKRSPFSTASSSSSSSSSSDGYGQSQTFSVSSNSVPGYDPYLAQAVPVYQNTYSQPGTFQATPVIYNRFGEDGGISGVGITGTSTGGNGVFSSSSSTVNSDGQVHYTAQTGKF